MFSLETALATTNASVSLVVGWRLLLAVVLGSLIGIERSVAGKHAGMRTYALVALGSALFTVLGTLASLQLSAFTSINPLQIAGSVVLGVGFIGSGLAILSSGTRKGGEITTAAGVWVAAAVGMACGFGFDFLAVFTVILVLAVFLLFSRVERSIQRRFGVLPEAEVAIGDGQ